MTAAAEAVGPSPMVERSKLLPFLALGGVVLIWGMGPPISKLITAPTTTIVAVRMWLAAPLALLAQRMSGSTPRWSTIKRAWKGGVFFGGNMLLFFTALKHVSVATITLIGVLQPIIVSLVSVRLFGERLTRWWAGWTAVAIGGVGIAVLTAGKSLRATPFGLLISICTISMLSGYLLASRSARRTLSPNEYLAGVMFWAAIMVTIPVLFQGLSLGQLSHRDWLWLLVILFGPGWLGHFLLNWAITQLPMSITALQGLPSTVLSIGLAWPINHEHVTASQGFAGLLTLTAIGMIVHGPLRRVRT